MDSIDRRNLLTGASIAGLAGLAAALPGELLAQTQASGNLAEVRAGLGDPGAAGRVAAIALEMAGGSQAAA